MNALECLINVLCDVCAIKCRGKLTRIALDFIPLGIVTANVDRVLATTTFYYRSEAVALTLFFLIMVGKLLSCFYHKISTVAVPYLLYLYTCDLCQNPTICYVPALLHAIIVIFNY